MATYCYYCETCDKEFEAVQSVHDEPLQECPTCKENGKISSPPKRLISKTNFTLVGGGWAKDRYSK
jgi:putative FmdB family regulatory protein